MGQKKVEASAVAGPGVLLGGEPGLSIANPVRAQLRTIPPLPDPQSGISVSEWRDSLVRSGYFKAVHVVDGELGPIARIGSPRVVVGLCDGETSVWCERRPWGFPDPARTFLGSCRAGAVRYAISVAEALREDALKEESWERRQAEARLREKAGLE